MDDPTQQKESSSLSSKSELSLRIAESSLETIVNQPNEVENEADMSFGQNQEETPTELEMREEISSPTTLENGHRQNRDEITSIKIGNNNVEKEAENDQIQTPEEMKKIIFTQNKLKLLLSGCPNEIFRSAVIGGFVRVNDSDRIFVDQIVDVLEPQSYQHRWLNRRIRLRHLGDFEPGKIFGLKIQNDSELRPYFDYMEAKGDPLPTKQFVKQKEQEIELAFQELALKEKKDAEGAEKLEKVRIKRVDLVKIALNPVTLRNLAKLEFQRFRSVITGCFVCMPAIRKDKSKDCQYHIVRVQDCIHGQRKYKVRNVATVDYQLVLPFYGNYIITWVKSFSIVTDEGFRQWIDDMKSWNEQIPTSDEIEKKAAELQLALNETEKIPSFQDLERRRQEEEEKAKKAKLPVDSAKAFEPCLLARSQLEKLAKLEDVELLTKILTGCFVRLIAGGGGQIEIDQILGMEVNEKKGGRTDRVLDLKYTGTISLTALIYIVSPQKLTEAEFREFAKKIASEKDENLPIIEFVDKKHVEIREALGEEEATARGSSSYESGELTSQGSNELLKPKIEPGGEDGEQKREMGQRSKFSLQTKDGELTTFEMRKVMLSITRMSDLMACNKETLAKIVRGMFIRIAARRSDKSKNEQFFTDEVKNVSWGGEPYRIRGNILTDIRLHCKNIGVKSLQQIYRTGGDGFNDTSLALFGEDMKKWKMELPTLAFIEKKNNEFHEALSKLAKIPRGSKAGRAMDVSYIGGQRGPVPSNIPGTPFKQSSPQMNPAFDQLQQYIQKQVVSSVLATPGLSQNWQSEGTSYPQIQQQFEQQGGPFNWQRQTDAFISGIGGSGGRKRIMPNGDPNTLDRETWRMQQQQQQKEIRRQRQQQSAPHEMDQSIFHGQFATSTPNPSSTMFQRASDGMERGEMVESLMNFRDFSAAIDQQQQPIFGAYQQDRPNPYDLRSGALDADQFFGASLMQNYNPTYIPASKRTRQSPEASPIKRFY